MRWTVLREVCWPRFTNPGVSPCGPRARTAFFAVDGPSQFRLCGSPPRRQGSSLFFDLTSSGFGLDGRLVEPLEQLCDVPAHLPGIGLRSPLQVIAMSDTSSVPSIQVTIGRQTRLYHAFVTTAPASLDAPSTLTLYEGPLINVVAFALDSTPLHASKARTPARLILIDTAELSWQKASCRAQAHRLTPADPLLVGFNTLQEWLWRRLQRPQKAGSTRIATS